MAELYYDNNADLGRLKGRTIAIIGFGSQGHAHAMNLKESGLDVVVGLYEGSKSRAKAEAAGLKVLSVAEASKAAQIIMIVTPDTGQAALYNKEIAPRPLRRQDADVRAWLQHPLRPDRRRRRMSTSA